MDLRNAIEAARSRRAIAEAEIAMLGFQHRNGGLVDVADVHASITTILKRFVVQTRTDGPAGGNCLAACLASILDVELEQIDTIALSTEGLWWPALVGVLKPFGLHPMHYAVGGEHFPPIAPAGVHIACNAKHATVAVDGVIVWDPSPSRRGLPTITEWILLLPIAQGGNNA